MPSKRLICMGLLSKYPRRSSVVQQFVKPWPKRRYTDFEKMHITAAYFTPGLQQRWLAHQFAEYGKTPDQVLWVMRRIAYNPENRRRWAHIGEQNVLFIGQPEVERYYARHPRGPNTQFHHPAWVIPILQDHRKQGMTIAAIAAKYGLHRRTVESLTKRSIFEPKRRNGGPQKWKSRSQG